MEPAVRGFGLRLAGVTLAVGGSLTLALGAVLFPLVVFLAPIAIVQAIAGLRAYAGRLHYLWVAIPCALVGIALGNGMTGGIAAPIAWASVAVNIIGIGAALMAAVDARDAPLDQ